MSASVSSLVRCRFLQPFEVQVKQKRISTGLDWLGHVFLHCAFEMFDQSTSFKMFLDPVKGFPRSLNLRCLTLMVSNVSVFILMYLYITCFQSTQLLSFSGGFFLNKRIHFQLNLKSAFSLWRRFHSG